MKFLTFLSFAAAVLPASVYGHIGFWHESCYGCAESDGYDPVTPLAGMSFNNWWFHGNLNKPPKAGVKPFELKAGGKAVTELSCRRQFTSMGTSNPGNDPCPIDVESMHAGNPFDDNQMLGCGLAIAYKSDASQVKPEDFVVFTVNHSCVKTLRTEFDVPAGMPECPNGKCICAWFWQGQDSANEMYMTGFDCTVTGGSKTATLATPKVPRYCKNNEANCQKGAKQPFYWANSFSQVAFSGIYKEKPSYNLAWGFSNGAQNDIFATRDTTPAPVVSSSRASSPAPTTFSTSTRAPAPPSSAPASSSTRVTAAPSAPSAPASGAVTHTIKETVTAYKTIYSTITAGSAAAPTAATCAWKGHCEGDRCNTYNDCDGNLTCTAGRCAQPALRGAKFRAWA